MLDVIHLIVTVLSDRPSFEWECNVTGRSIWFHPLKSTFRHVSVLLLLSNGMDAMLSGGLAKGRWAVLGMVTEGGDWVVRTSHFYGSHKGSWKGTRAREKAQLLYAGCVHFTADWLFWNLYGSYIAPRPLLSWKKPGNFRFDNMGPLRVTNRTDCYNFLPTPLCASILVNSMVPSWHLFGSSLYSFGTPSGEYL